MRTPTTEEQFVIAIARAALRAPGEVAPSRNPIDGPALLSVAARHGVRALVLEALSQFPLLPAQLDRDDVNVRRTKTAATNLMSLSAARGAIRMLDAHGVRGMLAASPSIVMMLEGVPYELGRAPIAVDASNIDAARALLQSAAVDIEPIDMLMLDRAADVRVAGGTIRAPAREDLLRALCTRAEMNARQGLGYVFAAALLLRTMNGVDAPIDPAILTATLLASDVLGVECPFTATARASADARAAALAIRESWFPPAGTASVMVRAAPSRAAHRELWVAGFPSPYGGADTELDHLIDLLRAHDVDVHLVPMFGADESTRQSVIDRGCHIHEYRDDIFRDKVVASFCNGEFLAALPAIMHAGRPARVVWFNCMTWLFDRERDAHARGWIDLFGFQSEYQRHALTLPLEHIGPVRTFPYRPYFHASRIDWSYRDWNGTYNVGRISRDDSAKYAPDTWRIFERIEVPAPLQKCVYVLGYGDNAARKIGAPPPGLSCEVFAPGQLPAADFYQTIDTMVHKTGGSRENYPRVLVEAYAYGVVPIVEKDFGFPELVVHGETGYLASSSEEMSEYATRLAHDPREHRRLAENGRRHLEETLSAPDACWSSWEGVLDV